MEVHFIKNLYKPGRFKSGTIFVVEDSDTWSGIISAYIRSCYPEVKEIAVFSSGEECLAALDRQPDLIVMDYFLDRTNPEAPNGLNHIVQIRHQSYGQNMVVFSGQNDMDVVIEAVKRHNCSYIYKDHQALPRLGEIIREIYEAAPAA